MNSQPLELPQFLTLSQAAERLAVCRRTLERQISARQLHAVKIGNATRIEVAELMRYVESRRSHQGAQAS